ncbi:MAG: four helix bundle protein [Candidatus Aminicenantia bacterium]
MLKGYKELNIWQKAYSLCLDIYRITKSFPEDEKYGLTIQMRRSAISVPSNIAEGYGRKSTQEYIHFLYIAYGSTCELETQAMIAMDLEYIKSSEKELIIEKISEVERMLKALINSLEKKINELK